MKIGIIADIHNNVVALETMLNKFKEENCEKIICSGDIIGIGPYPEQTVKRLREVPNLDCVIGNHDRYFVEGLPTEFPNEDRMELEEYNHHIWEHNLLSKESHDFLASLPYRLDLEIEGVKITALHYCMNENNKYSNFVSIPNIDDLNTNFSDIDSNVIIYGHNHDRCILSDDNKLFINCGSLGCPSSDLNIARGAILHIDNAAYSVNTLDLEYNVYEVINEINKYNYPSSNLIKKIFYGLR